MVINVIGTIQNHCGNKISSNVVRVQLIRENIVNEQHTNALFMRLNTYLLENDLTSVRDLIQYELFFEEVEGIEDLVSCRYNSCVNRIDYILALRKLYLERGVKGLQQTWMLFLLKNRG